MTLGFNTYKKWITDGKPPKSNWSNVDTSKRGKNSAATNMTSLHLYEETFSDEANSDDWLIDDNCHNFDDLKRKLSFLISLYKIENCYQAVGIGTIRIKTIIDGKNPN